jgi:hypothetical protein
MNDVEYAQTSGSHGFPRIWGRPAGDQWSEERAAWVRDRVCRFRGLAALDELARRDVKYLNDLRQAIVASQRNTP